MKLQDLNQSVRPLTDEIEKMAYDVTLDTYLPANFVNVVYSLFLVVIKLDRMICFGFSTF